MEKFIPYKKLSKKAQKEYDKKKRQTWENVNPSTRKIESKKAYNRKKIRREDIHSDFFIPKTPTANLQVIHPLSRAKRF